MPRVAAPAPPVSGDVLRITTLVIADSEQCQWSLDYMSNGFATSPAADQASILANFLTSYSLAIKSLLPVDAMFNGAFAAVLSRLDISTIFSTSGNGVGTGSANHLDKQLAIRVQKQSILKGAHGRGAFMFGPVTTTSITPATDANRLNAATITLWGVFLAALKGPLTASSGSGNVFAPCISTRPLVGTSLVTHAQPINSLVVDPIVGTVKRRRIGRGI